METYRKTHFMRDATSLAEYQPRNSAITLIKEARIEAFLDWEYEEGRQAAFGQPSAAPSGEERLTHLRCSLFLDIELFDRLTKAAPSKAQPQVARKGFKLVPVWMASPLEILLRRGNASGFKRVISQLTSPEIRFKYPELIVQIGNAWTSAGISLMAHGLHDWKYKDDVIRKHSLMSLALFLGKFEYANAMARHGICPKGSEQWHEFGVSFYVLSSLPRATLNSVVGDKVDDRTLSRATDWINQKSAAGFALEAACVHSGTHKNLIQAAADQAYEALELGAGFDYVPLARACEWARPDLLRSLFSLGADPNAAYKTGVPILCRINAEHITPEILGIWLEAGANPSRHGGGSPSSTPDFGNGNSPSALYHWTWAGREDLVAQACASSAVPIELTYEVDGKIYAPLLALALQRGHGPLSAWMIAKKGCRLDHLSPTDGEACRHYGKGDVLALAEATELKAQLGSALPAGKTNIRKVFNSI